jgi:hypothetical protein
MKNFLIAFLKDFAVAFSTWFVLIIGIILTAIFIDTDWSQFWVWIPTLLILWVIFDPLISYWRKFFNRLFNNECDTTQS